MSNIVKHYFEKRKDATEVYEFLEAGQLIRHVIPKLLHENKDHKIQYFIKSCQKSKKELLEKSDQKKIIISKEMIHKLEQLEIKDIYDCKNFGELLLNLHEELTKQYNTIFLFYPVNHSIRLTFLEVLLLLLLMIPGLLKLTSILL